MKCARAAKISSLFVIAAFYIYFVWAAISVSLPSENHPIQFYSNQTRHDFRLTLKEALKSAKRSIHITMYGLTDPDMVSLLQKKAEAGVDVKVFFDARAGENSLSSPVQLFPLRGKGLKHRKIVVIDDKLVFLGSANMTTTSLVAHDNLSVGLYHPELARYLTSNPKDPFYFKGGELWLLPHKEALNRLLSLIKGAKEKIFVSMFTLTHPILVEKLALAHKQGIEVTVAIDYFAGRGSSAKALETLRQSGVQILLSQGQQLLHHKWMRIDDKTLVMGSANWTKAAFSANQDFFLILSPLTPEQIRYFNTLCRIINLESKQPL